MPGRAKQIAFIYTGGMGQGKGGVIQAQSSTRLRAAFRQIEWLDQYDMNIVQLRQKKVDRAYKFPSIHLSFRKLSEVVGEKKQP